MKSIKQALNKSLLEESKLRGTAKDTEPHRSQSKSSDLELLIAILGFFQPHVCNF